MVPCRVVFAAPGACSRFGAFECVMAVTLTVTALGVGAKSEAMVKEEGGGEGREEGKECKVLCHGAGGSNNNSGRFFADVLFIWSEPSGRMCKHQPSVEGGKLFANVSKRVAGRDAVQKELCRGRVQLGGGSARN